MALLHYLVLVCGLLCLARAEFAVPASGSGSIPDCPNPDDFRCPDGSCVSLSLLCDDVPDCPSGADELVCVQPGPQDCRPDQHPCNGEQLCVSLAVRCDGVYDCSLGSDERNCPPPPPGSPCNRSQFVCALSGGCVPLAVRCDGRRDCDRSEDEQGCVPPLVIDPPPPSITSFPGQNVTLICVAEATPPPFITWLRNLQPLPVEPRYTVTSEDGVGTLVIRDVRALDVAEFTCQITSRLHGDQLALPATSVLVNDTFPITCEDQFGTPYSEGDSYYATQIFATGPANQAAADIIFVVDESGSMVLEHEWIREEVFNLDRRLREQGVGVGERENLFGLVGFARDSPSGIIGIVLSQLASPENFVAASQELLLNGLAEDGYAAIIHALDNILTRSGTSKQIILVTDEDRTVLQQDLNRDVVEERLREAGFVLNVVVNQGFLADPTDSDSHALGLDSNGTAYVVNTTAPALFVAVEGGGVDPDPLGGFGNTFSDYVELAFSLGGAAWDINQLREQGIFAEAFSNAFTEVKVEEVMSVFMVCALCTCASPEPICVSDDRSVESCFGPAPGVFTVVVTPSFTFVPPGSRVSFRCLVHGMESEDSLDITWTYPPQPGVVITGQTLLVSSAGLSSEGAYTCTVSDNSTDGTAAASGTLEIDERCTVGGSTLLPGETRIILEVPPGNMSKAADVILIVDESGSMTLEHAWIPDMTVALNGALREVGIGIEPQNRFGVVGFGADCEDPGFGRIITNNADQVFTFASNITEFTMSLDTSGRREDGYSGIKTALEGYEFRNVAKQFILITDEDRDVARPNLTRDVVREMLQSRGILLNVAVSEEFAGGEFRALGIDSRGNAYVYDPSAASLFRIIEGGGAPVEDSAHGTTNVDYTGLALELGGGAWDLSTLREGGEVAEAFTNAFVQVKVLEIRAQMEECLNCSCTPSGPVCEILQGDNFAECMPPPVTPAPGETALSLRLDPPEFAQVLPGGQVTVSCEANTSASLGWTFNGGVLPENAAVVPGSDGRSTQLAITGAVRDNTGTYACLGHTPSNAINAAAFIFIEYFDPAEDLQLSLSPLDPTVARGQNISLNCQVPEPAFFSWLFDFGPLPSNALTRDGAMESVLTVVQADASNIGGYTCLVNNTIRELVNEDTTYLDVREPVLVLSVAPQLVDVEEGATVSVLCTVDCFCPGAMLEWITSTGEPLPPDAEIFLSEGPEGEPRAELFFSSVVVGDSGRYLCSAQFQGMSTDLEAILTVRAIPPPFTVLIGGSDTVTLTAGSPYFALCEANRNTSLIQWQFNNITIPMQPGNQSDPAELVLEELLPEGLEVGNVVAVSLSPRRLVLAVLQASEENSGTYECQGVDLDGNTASDEIGIIVLPRPPSPTPTATEAAPSPSPLQPLTPSSLTASPFTIAPVTPSPPADASPTSRLLPTPSPSPLPPFSIAVSEAMLELEEGANASVICSSNHAASFVWTSGVDSTGLPSNARVEVLGPQRSQLLIVDIQQQNSGMYVCNASSRLTEEVATAITIIIVNATTPPPTTPPTTPPTASPTPDIPPENRIVTITPDNIRVPPGALAVFTCNANTVTQVFEWRFIFDDPVPDNAVPTMLNLLTSQLVIQNVSQDNAGTYFCHANFSDGIRRTGIARLIFDEPLKVRITPHPEARVPEGNRTQIDCSLDCACGGDTRLNWRRVGSDSLPDSAMLMPSPSGRTVSLIFESTPADVAGMYECIATRTSSEPAWLGVELVVE